MVSSRTSVRTTKLDKEPHPDNISQTSQTSKTVKPSAGNVYHETGNRFVVFSGNSRESKKPTPSKKESSSKEKIKKPIYGRIKTSRKVLINGKLKEELQERKKSDDRDFRKIKSRYNAGVGNILREWVNLIYCILILRMNLIKFIIEKFPDFGQNDVHLQKQIVLESKIIYKIIRKAQRFSQEQFLHMWTHLDKLILNRMTLRNALGAIQLKDSGETTPFSRGCDWKAASEKLVQLQDELEKAQTTCKAIQRNKTQFELSAKDKLSKLESLTNSRNAELEDLMQQITELKNNEFQMRGRIVLNMKSYRDLRSKKQSLLNVEKEMNQLKTEQSTLIKDYATKIQFLKNQVEASEKQIKAEKEEKQKIKATLAGLGDFSEKRSIITLDDS